jgi:peptidoglycan/LPS O-acetylase OafA/YrhL
MQTARAHAETTIAAPAGPVPHAPATHDIPSLNGLRAVSIAIVILSHTRSLFPAAMTNSGLFRYVIGGGLHGVQIFFVISGYLITTLLLREQARSGAVSLKRFYARRCLRIFPPFYAYLVVLGILWIDGWIPEHGPTFLAAATYTLVYLPHPQGWCVEHAWSLSIEEQFYLLWPALLVFAHRRGKSLQTALCILALMPVERIVLASFGAGQFARGIVNSGSIDMLMVGCLLAILKNRAGWEGAHRRFLNAWSAAAMVAVGFVLVPYVAAKQPGSSLVLALGNSITALCIGGVALYLVEDAYTPVARFLNLRPIRHIGVVSYSLYLWQQLFTDPDTAIRPAVYLFMLLAAECSFWMIEKPVQRLRERLNL